MLYSWKANSNRINEEGENGKFNSFKTTLFSFTGARLQLGKLCFSQMHVVGFNTGQLNEILR